MAPTTKKAKARHSGRYKRSGLRPGDGGRNSKEGSAGAVGGDEKKARRAKTKDGEPSAKSSSKARSPSAPSSLKRGGVHGGVEAAKSASPARNLLLRWRPPFP